VALGITWLLMALVAQGAREPLWKVTK